MAKNDLELARFQVDGYRKLIDFMVKNKCFRGYSTLDFVMEKIRRFDPDYFKDSDDFMEFMKKRDKEEN